MVEGIAHQMQERVPNLFHDRFIELSLFARNAELYLFPQMLAKVVNHTWKTIKGKTDGEHTDAHDAFLQLAGVTL
jgi:hypothetical protein